MNPNLSPSAIDVIDALAKRYGDSVAQDAIRTIIELSNELASARAERINTMCQADTTAVGSDGIAQDRADRASSDGIAQDGALQSDPERMQ